MFRDDAQLRCSFRPWLRWLPTRILWKLATWWYYHAGKGANPVAVIDRLLQVLIIGVVFALLGIGYAILTGTYIQLAIYLAVVVIFMVLGSIAAFMA